MTIEPDWLAEKLIEMDDKSEEIDSGLSIVIAAIMNSANFDDCKGVISNAFELHRTDVNDDEEED